MLLVAILVGVSQPALADPPAASYIFPAGGQRGTTVPVRVGGLYLHSKASFEMLGPGVETLPEVRRLETIWFEGPRLPLPDSQLAEDYPQDYSGRVTIAANAPAGARAWRIWTSQGASGSLPFVVGDLPEVVEREVEGDPEPEVVSLPVTINGRIFPREDVDLWAFQLRAGQAVTGAVEAGRLGSPLDPWLEVLADGGRRIAEAVPSAASDGRVAFVAPHDGTYSVKIHDVSAKGGQNYVYRLSLRTGPSVERVFPLGGRRGSVVNFAVSGLECPDHTGPVSLTSLGAGCGPERSVIPFAARASAVVEVDDLPESVEIEPNARSSQASSLSVPGVGNGRIGAGGDVDFWAVPLRKGRSYRLELRAGRLGSSLDGLLFLTDTGGKELARAESTAEGADPSLMFQPPADGAYLVSVRDRFRSRGGPAWAYRLRVDETPAADFRLTLPSDTLTVPRGGSAKVKVETERLGGFAGPIALVIEGLPPGVSAGKTVIAPGAGSIEMTCNADNKAPIRSARVTVRGTAEIGGRRITRIAARRGLAGFSEIDSIRLAVALPAPFQIAGRADFGWAPRGSVRHRRYRIQRGGFSGPIEIRLADRQARHLQGVTGPVVIVPPRVEEFEYAVMLPPWMEIGRTSRTVLMATGLVREPDGTEHEVSFSSPSAEVQLIAVIEPARLGLESTRTSLAIAPGRTLEVPVKLARGRGVNGPVRVELVVPRRVIGLRAEPLVLSAGQDQGIMRIACATVVVSPRTDKVILRAQARVGVDPIFAEAKLTIVAEPD
jgi:hypothetical protein